MPVRSSSKALLTISMIANLYFWIQVLLFQLPVHRYVLVGVFTELLTIPCLIALAVSAVLLPVGLHCRWLPPNRRPLAWALLLSTGALVVLALRS
ncbi:MAG: hypothetical protein EOO16_06815 [Chitinophagaceae bacterium]|nr:MAG: hypothetical protein EOO16_06815 [Chitinophagaceae bacterium]